MRSTILFSVIILYSCHEGKTAHPINPAAKRLNDSAVSIATKRHDYAKAISFLDRSLRIDSAYLTAYSNKLLFLEFIKPVNVDMVLETLKKLNTLRPQFPDYYLQIGTIYLKRGDSVTSQKYFADAIIHYDMFLDTMHASNNAYESLLTNKSFALILQGNEKEGHDVLNKVYKLETDSSARKEIARMLQKSRKEVLDSLSIE
jgi:tetratricopeptide (TPR) repeat protein